MSDDKDITINSLTNNNQPAKSNSQAIKNVNPNNKNDLVPKHQLIELLENFKKSLESPIGKMPKLTDINLIMQHSFLSGVAGTKLGKLLFGDQWKKDVQWLKEEINKLISLKNEESDEIDVLNDLKIVPKIRYWGKNDRTEEIKNISKKLRDENKSVSQIIKREKTLTELKMQLLKTELKAKLIDLKLANC